MTSTAPPEPLPGLSRTSAAPAQDAGAPPERTPPALTAALDAFARQDRRTAMWRGWAEASLVAAGALVVGAANDAWLHPSYSGRCLVALGGALVVSGVLAWRVLRPWWRGAPPVAVARALEAAAAARGKGLDQRLSAAIELAGQPPRGVSAWMVGRTLALAAQEAAALAPASLIDVLPGRKAWRRTGAAALVMAVALAVPGVPTFYLRALWPPANLERPSRVKLVVDGGDRVVAEGAAMDLAVAADPDPGAAVAELRWDDGASERLDMVGVAGTAGAGGTATGSSATGHYTAHLGAVTRGFTFHVLAGDGETRQYHVQTAPPPRVERVELRVRPPAYTGLPPLKHAGGDLEIVAGSSVTITAVLAGEAAVAAALVCDGGDANGASVEQAARVLPVAGGGMGAVQATVTPTASMTWHLRLVGANGLRAETAERWQMVVVPDRAPTATVAVPGGLPPGGTVALDEPLALAVAGVDDLGLASLDLEITTSGGTPIRQALDLPAPTADGPPARAETTIALDPSAYGLAPGDHLIVTAVATDRGGQEGRSAPLDIAVAARSDGDLAAAAERLAGARGRLADAVKELADIAKAWNGLGHDQPNDELAWRGDMLLLRERAATWTTDIAGIAADTAQGAADSAGNADSAPASAGLAAAARVLDAWGAGIGGQLDVEAATALASPAALPQARARAMAVLDAAGRDLERLSGDLSALGLGPDAAALALRAHDAGARAAHALVLLRGDLAWHDGSYQVGLSGVFYNGTALQGDPVWHTVAPPDFDQFDVPGIGHYNFSARYTGEVQVPEDGDWVFTATADDGVRLSIDGAALLPPQAWVQQPPTPWSGTVHLAKGWHALVVEYYQGPGGNHLDVAMGHPGQPAVVIPAERLRTRQGVAVDAGLAAAMVRAVPGAVAQAQARAQAAWTVLAGVPPALESAAGAGGGDPLHQLATQSATPAATLTTLPPRRDDWTMAALDNVGAAANAVADAAAHAPAAVAGAVANAVNAEADPGPLPELRIAIANGSALINRADQVAADPGDRAARGRAVSGAESGAGQAARAAVAAADALADGSGCDAPTRLERAAAIRSLSRLQDQALAEQSVVNAAARHAELHLGVAATAIAPLRQPAWAAMAASLKSAEDAVIAAGVREDAALARTALAAATSMDAARAAGADGAQSPAISGDIGTRLGALARLRRAHGDPAAADALARLAAAPGPIDQGALAAALGAAVTAPAAWPEDATLTTAKNVREAAMRIALLVPLPPDPADPPIVDNGLTAIAFTCSDGAAQWGHFGVLRGKQEITFIGDDLPAGGNPDGGNDGWAWSTDNPPPGGKRAHVAKWDAGMHQHLVAVPAGAMPVLAGDVFFIDVRLDAAKPPQEMLLQLQLNGDWSHRASWGGDDLATLISLHVGALPEAGQWARLEVPVEALGFALDPEHPPAPFFADGEEVAPSAPVTQADKAHARQLAATAQHNDAKAERERRERASAATAAHLATAAAGLVLVAEGERRRGDGRSDQAPAFNALARAAAALADADPPADAAADTANAQALRVLAKKIADLANKPAKAQKPAIAAADPASRLQGLAKDAHDAVDHHDQRAALQAELATAANPAAATPDRNTAARELEAALKQAQAADAGASAARIQAAANADALARDLDAFAAKSTQDAAATGDAQTKAALTAAAAAAKAQSTEAAALAAELKKDPASAAGNASGSTPAPTASALATRTDADARAIADGVAAPLATASQSDPQSVEAGRSAAAFAAKAQDSAAALDASEARRVAAQQRLAAATAQAAAAAGAPDPGPTQAAADAATAQAAAASQTAAAAWGTSAAAPQDGNALNAAHAAQDKALAAQQAAAQAQAAAVQAKDVQTTAAAPAPAPGQANGAKAAGANAGIPADAGKGEGGAKADAVATHDPVVAEAAGAAAAGGDAAELAAGAARLSAAAGNAAAGGGDPGAATAARNAANDAAAVSVAAEPRLESAAQALAQQLAATTPVAVAGTPAAAGEQGAAINGGGAADAGAPVAADGAAGAGADPAAAGAADPAGAQGGAAAPGPGQGAGAPGQVAAGQGADTPGAGASQGQGPAAAPGAGQGQGAAPGPSAQAQGAGAGPGVATGAGKASGTGAGAPAGAGSAGGDDVADPARQALAMIAVNPADDANYRNAAATLDAAAAAARMDGAAGAGVAGSAAGAGAAGAAAAAGAGSGGKGGSGGKSGPGPSKGSGNSPGGSAAGVAGNPGGGDHPDWARLSDQAQRDVRSEGIDHFSVEHQEAIRAYLQRLAEGK